MHTNVPSSLLFGYNSDEAIGKNRTMLQNKMPLFNFHFSFKATNFRTKTNKEM